MDFVAKLFRIRQDQACKTAEVKFYRHFQTVSLHYSFFYLDILENALKGQGNLRVAIRISKTLQ